MSTAAQTNALFYKPELAVGDPEAFGSVRSSIEGCFSAAKVRDFLASLDGRKLRIRNFEAILGQGLLGRDTAQSYSRLAPGDQGQIREFYLASLERVSPALRQKFFRLYSYY